MTGSILPSPADGDAAPTHPSTEPGSSGTGSMSIPVAPSFLVAACVVSTTWLPAAEAQQFASPSTTPYPSTPSATYRGPYGRTPSSQTTGSGSTAPSSSPVQLEFDPNVDDFSPSPYGRPWNGGVPEAGRTGESSRGGPESGVFGSPGRGVYDSDSPGANPVGRPPVRGADPRPGGPGASSVPRDSFYQEDRRSPAYAPSNRLPSNRVPGPVPVDPRATGVPGSPPGTPSPAYDRYPGFGRGGFPGFRPENASQPPPVYTPLPADDPRLRPLSPAYGSAPYSLNAVPNHDPSRGTPAYRPLPVDPSPIREQGRSGPRPGYPQPSTPYGSQPYSGMYQPGPNDNVPSQIIPRRQSHPPMQDQSDSGNQTVRPQTILPDRSARPADSFPNEPPAWRPLDSSTGQDRDPIAPANSIQPSPGGLQGPELPGLTLTRPQRGRPLPTAIRLYVPDVSCQAGSLARTTAKIRNDGNEPIRDVSLIAETGDELKFANHSSDQLVIPVSYLAPGEERELPLSLVSTEAGQHKLRWKLQAEGVDPEWKTSTVESIPRRFEVQVISGRQRSEGQQLSVTCRVSNLTAATLAHPELMLTFDDALGLKQATSGARRVPGAVTWTLATLGPHETAWVTATFDCRHLSHESCLRAIVRSDGLEDVSEQPVFIDDLRPTCDVQILDPRDPTPAGESRMVMAVVRNRGFEDRTLELLLTLPQGCTLQGVSDANKTRRWEVIPDRGAFILRSDSSIRSGESAVVGLNLQLRNAGVHRIHLQLTDPAGQVLTQTHEPLATFLP